MSKTPTLPPTNNRLSLSYWEQKTWFRGIDFAIVGSGIVGLSCALSLREQFPMAKIVVFEKGMLPSGASTKNAGFACFGSVSELLSDLETHTEEEVIALVKSRLDGLQLLRDTLGDKTLDYQANGGYELFTTQDTELYEKSLDKLSYLNSLLRHLFSKSETVFSAIKDPYAFKNIQERVIFNSFEGQIDTGKMMRGLLKKVSERDILLLNNAQVTSCKSKGGAVDIQINNQEVFSVKKVCIATNGFAKQLIKEQVTPARAQVLVTQPIKNLHIKGTFHLEQGYYYFRNIDNRVLIGGGRNLDLKREETTDLGLTAKVQEKLEELLNTTILPGVPFEIDQRWSGIMGVGNQKKPIIKQVEPNVFCGVRLGGMGVAIGSAVGKQLAEITTRS